MLPATIQILRPIQWLKSLFVLSGIVYSQQYDRIGTVLLACISFSFISSAVYIYNDMHDIKEDQQHPLKRKRAIAAGMVKPVVAFLVMFALIIGALSIAFYVSHKLVLILMGYVLVNLFYNHGAKQIPWLDVSCISAGFFLRIAAGTWGVGINMSIWLCITATLLSFYLALSKRFLEQHLLAVHEGRAVLQKYNMLTMRYGLIASASLCLLAYITYILQVHAQSNLFILTIVPVTIGVGHFTQRVLSGKILVDDPLLILAYDKLSQLYLGTFFLMSILAIKGVK